MENVLTFLKIVFLGKSILLTPDPITLTPGWTTISTGEAINSITGGAVIHIELSKTHATFGQQNSVPERQTQFAKKIFPAGTLAAIALTANGQEIEFLDGNYSFSKKSSKLILSPSSTIPEDLQFVELKLKSTSEIGDVRIVWQNYSL